MINYKNIFSIAILSILFIACGNDKKGNFTLKGHIKDLKKGTVYLQKDENGKIIDLDSVVIKGDPNFVLSTYIKEPILLYLKLHKNDGQEHYIPFFADKGVTEISTTLKGFSGKSKIKGSKQQLLFENYLKLMSDFKNKNLDIIKSNFEAIQRKDSIASDSLQKESDRFLRLRYAATINFALNNSDSEVSPYLALYEIPNTSVKFLDSIYSNLKPNIKKSFYGKTLGDFLTEFKKSTDSISK